MLKNTENTHKIYKDSRIKFVEKCGKKNIDALKVSDPFRKNCPPVKDCLPCRGKEKYSHCQKSNVGYQLWCKLCEETGFEKTYEGESCRNAFLRGREHERQYKNNDKNSVILKHVKAEHKEELEKVVFDMKVTKSFHKPINRIINEGIRIKNRNRSTLLNSKNEHYGPRVKRKIVENMKECNICGSRFKSEYTFKMHTESVHESNNIQCETCQIIFKTIDHMNRHKENEHDRRLGQNSD